MKLFRIYYAFAGYEFSTVDEHWSSEECRRDFELENRHVEFLRIEEVAA
jgi:hypothetical protein